MQLTAVVGDVSVWACGLHDHDDVPGVTHCANRLRVRHIPEVLPVDVHNLVPHAQPLHEVTGRFDFNSTKERSRAKRSKVNADGFFQFLF